jgi:hypothetical protein
MSCKNAINRLQHNDTRIEKQSNSSSSSLGWGLLRLGIVDAIAVYSWFSS